MNKNNSTEKKNGPLGDYIRTRRESRGLDRMTVAEAAGIDYSYIGKLESGEYRQPSPNVLNAIAKTIGCKPADLYALAGYKIGGDLPGFGPYLRAKYHRYLPGEAIEQLESYFKLLRSYYGIPDDEPVFPPKPETSDPPERRAA